MAAPRPCTRWELFFHPARRRSMMRWGIKETSRIYRAAHSFTPQNSYHSTRPFPSTIYHAVFNPSNVTIENTSWRMQQPSHPPLTSVRCLPYSTSTTSEIGPESDNILNSRDTPPTRKRGRPPGARNKRATPVPLANIVQQDTADDIGIPFGYRRDVAGKWKELAGLDVDDNLYHRNIWWLWLEKCNEVWSESQFDVSKTWREQNIDKRLIARESVKRYVYDEDIVGSHIRNESQEWKENVKRVLASDAGIDFKLIRIHGSYRRAWKLLDDKAKANSARR